MRSALFEPFLVDCPLEQLWHDLGRSWVLPLISILQRGAHSFGELRRALDISQKVLADRLALLERYRFVDRTPVPTDPRGRVHYSLTRSGHDFAELVQVFASFCREHGFGCPPDCPYHIATGD